MLLDNNFLQKFAKLLLLIIYFNTWVRTDFK